MLEAGGQQEGTPVHASPWHSIWVWVSECSELRGLQMLRQWAGCEREQWGQWGGVGGTTPSPGPQADTGCSTLAVLRWDCW